MEEVSTLQTNVNYKKIAFWTAADLIHSAGGISEVLQQ
jgi:hypothetical protein